MAAPSTPVYRRERRAGKIGIIGLADQHDVIALGCSEELSGTMHRPRAATAPSTGSSRAGSGSAGDEQQPVLLVAASRPTSGPCPATTPAR